jgi:hypothetical protein
MYTCEKKAGPFRAMMFGSQPLRWSTGFNSSRWMFNFVRFHSL